MILPLGNPLRHLGAEALARGFEALPPPPRGEGRLMFITARGRAGRLTPAEARLSVEGGLEGDRWTRGRKGDDDQLTLMRADVGRLIANGQPLSHFGDNLLVELDLDEALLPPGARLALGEALLQVTPDPHRGCARYRQRFGGAALAFVNAPERRALRLRGLHARVLRGGVIRIGDAIRVI